ncbi:MAG: SGNH/GDSL hydrolase family protein [Clostridiales bacterium]|nr:SGNH/GDSL hydrolase family protein [Clostridiales bacterium]
MDVSRSYSLGEYIRPLWVGDTVAHETVLFREDEREAKLAFPMDEIGGVYTADLGTEFEEGRDYLLRDGSLVRPEGSRMPFIPLDRFYPAEHRDGQDFGCTEEGHPFLGFGEGDAMIRFMVDVTYRHAAVWDGPIPPPQTDKCVRFLDKLARGEEATILFYGDSITTGANSSGVVGVPPHAEPFPVMTARALAEKYGYTLSIDVIPYGPVDPVKKTGSRVLHYVNTAVGGMDSKWGLANVGERAIAYQPDLMILAFGMNDGWRSCAEFTDLTKQIARAVQKDSPMTDILLLSSILPHWRAAGFYGHQIEYEDGLWAFAEGEEHIGVAPMTSMHRHLLRRKEYYHATGNNVNHPSDFMARVYAMTLCAALGV